MRPSRRTELVAPLSPAQERFWFYSAMEIDQPTYNTSVSFALRGPLDTAALERAFRALTRRHAALRTRFEIRAAEPVQIVEPEVRASPCFHAAHIADEPYEAAVPRMLDELAAEPFDLSRAPLVRLHVVRSAPETFTLLLVIHHLVSDAWSINVLLRDLREAYNALAAGRDLPEHDDPGLYAEHALRERGAAAAKPDLGDPAFWREYLAGTPQSSAFPADFPRSRAALLQGSHLDVRVPEDVTRALESLARSSRVTLFGVLATAYAIVLARSAGQRQVVFGIPVANRNRPDTRDVVGPFVNTVPVALDLGGCASFADALQRMQRSLGAALRHQHVPFERIVEAVRPERQLARHPIVQTLLNYRAIELEGEGWRGLAVVREHRPSMARIWFDLSLTLEKKGGLIECRLDYPAALFDPRTVERVAGRFTGVLATAAADRDTALRALPVLQDDERERLRAWNATDTPYPAGRRFHELFEACAARVPHAVALVSAATQLSYGALNARANRLAHHLRGLGIGPDHRVVLCAERGIATIAAQLAVLKAGAAYVPLDPAYPLERVRFVLEDCAPAAVLVHGALPAPLRAALGRAGAPVLDLCADAGSWARAPRHDLAGGGAAAGDPAYVIYTSGSTGRPKGVVVAHRAVCNLAHLQRERLGLGAPIHVLQFASFSFDVSVGELALALATGGTLHLAEPGTVLAGDTFVAAVNERGLTHALVTPAVLAGLPDADLPSLRVLISGGEAMTKTLADRFSPGRRLFNVYGPTEATVYVTMHRCEPGAESAPPIGRPVPNVRVQVHDGDGDPAPIGAAGEVCIGGAQLALGYLGRPALTAQHFVPDPLDRGGRLYRSGDLARFTADGELEFAGRKDLQVKLRGYRIEPNEIEARLAEHPAVREAVVVVREDDPGDQRLVAYAVLAAAGGQPPADELRAHCAATLPAHMVPAAFVALAAIPLTSNGKVDRSALPPPQRSAYAARDYEPPSGAIEETVAVLWAELLKAERVGRHDDFFRLGGHSLLAVRMLSRVHQRLKIPAKLGTLFSHTVLRDFARALGASDEHPVDPIVPADRARPLPLSSAQRRLWFLARNEAASGAYHMRFGVRLRGALDERALRRALDRITERHEALRTTFAERDGEPMQVIAPAGLGFTLTKDVVAAGRDAEEALRAFAEAENAAQFDLCAGPLIRGRLVVLGEDDHALLIAIHHIVSDGWSMAVFARELGILYAAYRHGGSDPLPPLPLQYADYAGWQRRRAESDALRDARAYWKDALAGAPALLALPADRPRPSEQHYDGGRVALSVDAELVRTLRALARRHGTTLFAVVLAAWGVVLGRLAGEDDVVVGTPIANRGRVDLEGLIGFFVNTLALRLDLSGAPTVTELLARVAQRTRAAQEHQELPFEDVVELLQPPRSLAYPPVVQVMFAWQNNEAPAIEFPALEVTPAGEPVARAKFDLTLDLHESGDRIAGDLEYATALFDRETVERYAGYVVNVLRGMTAGDETPVERLALLSRDERHEMLVGWNSATLEPGGERCAHELFEAAAARAPHAVAVACGDERFSYAEVNRRADQLTRRLRALGAAREQRVAVCMERGAGWIVGLFAALKAGCAYVPLDPSYPVPRLRSMIVDSDPVALLDDGSADASLRALFAERNVPVIDVRDAAPASAADAPPKHRAPRSSDAAYVIYTSGSTGDPKGVVVEHGHLVDSSEARRRAYGGYERFLLLSSFAFDSSIAGIFGTLNHGGTLVVARDDEVLQPSALRALIARHGVSAVLGVPSLLSLVLDGGDENLGSLKQVIAAGEPLPALLVRQVRERMPWATLCNEYGPTETTVWATVHACRGTENAPVPIGRPIRGTRAYVLDGRNEPVAVRAAGELCLGGAQVARGYLGRPGLTAERFVPNPFARGERMYRTGDLVRYRSDGSIEFLGRKDFQVKVRGFRIEPGEIEARLAEYPGVREAVVVVREDEPGRPYLAAYVTGVPAAAAGDRLRAHLGALLPEAMVPVAYVALETIPRTPNGKVDRKALPPPNDSAYARRAYEPPRGAAEAAVSAAWSELLKVERIGRHDNFFALGGHSLLAVRAVAQIGRELGIAPSVRDLFRHQTVAEFAATIRNAPPPLELPLDRPRISTARSRCATIPVELDPALVARLAAFGCGRGVERGAAFLAGFATLLARLAGRESVVVGTPLADPIGSKLESVVGAFAELLTVEIDVVRGEAAADLVERVTRRTSSARESRRGSLGERGAGAKPSRFVPSAPVQAVFARQTDAADRSRTAPLRPIDLAYAVTSFDVMLLVTESAETVGASLGYAEALFDRSTAQRFARELSRILGAMADHGGAAVAAASGELV